MFGYDEIEPSLSPIKNIKTPTKLQELLKSWGMKSDISVLNKEFKLDRDMAIFYYTFRHGLLVKWLRFIEYYKNFNIIIEKYGGKLLNYLIQEADMSFRQAMLWIYSFFQGSLNKKVTTYLDMIKYGDKDTNFLGCQFKKGYNLAKCVGEKLKITNFMELFDDWLVFYSHKKAIEVLQNQPNIQLPLNIKNKIGDSLRQKVRHLSNLLHFDSMGETFDMLIHIQSTMKPQFQKNG